MLLAPLLSPSRPRGVRGRTLLAGRAHGPAAARLPARAQPGSRPDTARCRPATRPGNGPAVRGPRGARPCTREPSAGCVTYGCSRGSVGRSARSLPGSRRSRSSGAGPPLRCSAYCRRRTPRPARLGARYGAGRWLSWSVLLCCDVVDVGNETCDQPEHTVGLVHPHVEPAASHAGDCAEAVTGHPSIRRRVQRYALSRLERGRVVRTHDPVSSLLSSPITRVIVIARVVVPNLSDESSCWSAVATACTTSSGVAADP